MADVIAHVTVQNHARHAAECECLEGDTAPVHVEARDLGTGRRRREADPNLAAAAARERLVSAPDWGPIPINTYPRPKGATPLRVPLVPVQSSTAASQRKPASSRARSGDQAGNASEAVLLVSRVGLLPSAFLA
jgi:hypothetical protein